MAADPRTLDAHFAFGENWQAFLDTVTDDGIAEAMRNMESLFPDGALAGRSFLDIGCGSRLAMLAALGVLHHTSSQALCIAVHRSNAIRHAMCARAAKRAA